MRFGLRHLFAITTLFAILIAIATATDAINRNGIWTVESIATEDWGGSWHGEDPATGEPCGGAILMYVAKLRDGDRTRFACIGEDIDEYADINRPELPKTGDSFVFMEAGMLTVTPLFSGSQLFTGTPPGSPSFFAVDDHAFMLPAQASDGYSSILNVIVVFVLSVLAVLVFEFFCRVIRWLPSRIESSLQKRRERRERYRKTHIY